MLRVYVCGGDVRMSEVRVCKMREGCLCGVRVCLCIVQGSMHGSLV